MVWSLKVKLQRREPFEIFEHKLLQVHGRLSSWRE